MNQLMAAGMSLERAYAYALWLRTGRRPDS